MTARDASILGKRETSAHPGGFSAAHGAFIGCCFSVGAAAVRHGRYLTYSITELRDLYIAGGGLFAGGESFHLLSRLAGPAGFERAVSNIISVKSCIRKQENLKKQS